MKLLAILLLFHALDAFAATKTNLLFTLTDNHGAWTLGCYGNKEVRTPNIDKLAAEGTLFSRAYLRRSDWM